MLLVAAATGVPVIGAIGLARWMGPRSDGACIGCPLVILIGVAVGTGTGLATWYATRSQTMLPATSSRTAPAPVDRLALVTLGLAAGSFLVFPLLPAVVALFLAPQARRRIRRSEGAARGEGVVAVGQIVAISNIVMVAAAAVVFVM